MKNFKRLIFSVTVLFTISSIGKSQNVGVGADIMYNFQTESFGAGARANIFPNNRLSFVPQASYYFAFNKVEEYYLGLSLEYKVIQREKVNLYALAHGAYNNWLSYERSPMKGAKLNNWNGELGIGISNNKCLRPFLEYRYNFKFKETHLRLGFLYIFGCSGKDKADRCAAY
jgi:hypothetical protein